MASKNSAFEIAAFSGMNTGALGSGRTGWRDNLPGVERGQPWTERLGRAHLTGVGFFVLHD